MSDGKPVYTKLSVSSGVNFLRSNSTPASDLSVLFSPLCVVPDVIMKFDDMLYYASKENFTVMPAPHI